MKTTRCLADGGAEPTDGRPKSVNRALRGASEVLPVAARAPVDEHREGSWRQ